MRLDRREFEAPVAQLQDDSHSLRPQAVPGRTGARQCLLEQCERNFLPNHPLDRYCSRECLAAARRWQVRYANVRYRHSERGKLRRSEQSKRHRVRRREHDSSLQAANLPTIAPQNAPEPCSENLPEGPPTASEGYTKDEAHEKSCCQRPGCYRRFTPPPQSPLKKFCSSRCRKALRRVILRERRWFLRLKFAFPRARDGPRGTAW